MAELGPSELSRALEKLSPAAHKLLRLLASYGGEVPLSFLGRGDDGEGDGSLQRLLQEIGQAGLIHLQNGQATYEGDFPEEAFRTAGTLVVLPEAYLPAIGPESDDDNLMLLLRASTARMRRLWLRRSVKAPELCAPSEETWILYGYLLEPPGDKELRMLGTLPTALLSLLHQYGRLDRGSLRGLLLAPPYRIEAAPSLIAEACRELHKRPFCFLVPPKGKPQGGPLDIVLPREWRGESPGA